MSYQLDVGLEILDQELIGDTIIFAERVCEGLFRSTLTAGAVKFTQTRTTHMVAGSTLTDCLVHTIKPQRNAQFFNTRFINCRFKGIFSSIDFGNSIGRYEGFGQIKCGDFSQARLDGCRFVNTDVVAAKIIFPAKDHVVILEPYKRSADVQKMQWPSERLNTYMEIVCDKEVELFKAKVMHIPSMARLTKCTPEQVKKALQQFGGVTMND
jgi:hypothetical protein